MLEFSFLIIYQEQISVWHLTIFLHNIYLNSNLFYF